MYKFRLGKSIFEKNIEAILRARAFTYGTIVLYFWGQKSQSSLFFPKSLEEFPIKEFSIKKMSVEPTSYYTWIFSAE